MTGGTRRGEDLVSTSANGPSGKQQRSEVGMGEVGRAGSGKVQACDLTMSLREKKDVTRTEVE